MERDEDGCPTCTDAERRYEDLLEVHGKTVARVAELEAEQGTTHAILQELSDTDRLCLCGKCLPCRSYTVLNPTPK